MSNELREVALSVWAILPAVSDFITRHTAYNKHDTGWAKGAPSEDHTAPPFSRTASRDSRVRRPSPIVLLEVDADVDVDVRIRQVSPAGREM